MGGKPSRVPGESRRSPAVVFLRYNNFQSIESLHSLIYIVNVALVAKDMLEHDREFQKYIAQKRRES